MSNQNDANDGLKLSDRATLSLLSTLESDDRLTQRGLAARIGVALGLTNSLLKRAIHKGLVKVQQAPAKRFAYYVTPKGFSEKTRLVADYLSSSLTFFRQAREEYTTLFEEIRSQNGKRIALFGMGELAEIAILSAQACEVELQAVIHPGSNQVTFSELSVISSLEGLNASDYDAVVITNAETPQDAYEALVTHFGEKSVYAVPLLHISQSSDGRVER